MIAVGFVLRKAFVIDSKTLAAVNIYIFVPALLFTRIYYADVTLNFIMNVFEYILIIMVLMYIMGFMTTRIMKMPVNISRVFINSLLFFNSGNYGLPLVELVFKNNPIATTGQIIILLIQNITVNTFGVFQASSGKSGRKIAIMNVVKQPAIYVIVIVAIVKGTGLHVPDVVLTPLNYFSGGFVAVALITLGVQLAEVRIGFRMKEIAVSCFLKLIVSPVLGFALVLLLGIKGILAQSLIIGVSLPSAVNTAIIARQYDNEPEYASQIVFVSTLASTVTLSIVIYLVTRFM